MTTHATWQVFYPRFTAWNMRRLNIARRTGRLNLLNGKGRWCSVSATDAARLAELGAVVRLIGGR